MARSNVGTPKFYIDYIQYWNAMGLLDGIGPYLDGGTNDEGITNEFKDVLKGRTAYRPQLVGRDPSTYMDNNRTPFTYVSGHDVLLYFIILNERVYLPKNGKIWIGNLNHNFKDSSMSISNMYGWKTLNYSGWSDTGYGYASNSSWHVTFAETNTIIDGDDYEYKDIVNMPQGTGCLFNGFSISQINNANVDGLNSFDPDLPLPQYIESLFDINPPAPEDIGPYGPGSDSFVFEFKHNGDGNEIRNIMGSLNFGGVYEMPHSPDLSLTMTREYDGIDTFQSMSGRKFSNIRYTGTPNWRNDLPAWHLTTKLANTAKRVGQTISRGRRIWDLQFSYISSDDLFPVNEGSTPHNPTDSYAESDSSGYDTSEGGDFNPPFPWSDVDNEFSSHLGMDDSFMGVVMDKTMGGALPVVFQPDSNNNSPDQFAICEIDQDSISFELVANNVYNVSLKIREVW